MKVRWFIPIFVLSLLTLSLTWPQGSPERRLERPRIDLTAEVTPQVGDTPDDLVAAGVAIDAYLAAHHEEQLAGFYASVQADLDRRAVEEASARRAGYSGASHPGTTTGECSGFAIPDYIIMRESGGNPSAYNPSGAYGCAQTLLSHYSSGSCAGLDPYTIDGQRECVWRLSNGGQNLAPWAMTR